MADSLKKIAPYIAGAAAIALAGPAALAALSPAVGVAPAIAPTVVATTGGTAISAGTAAASAGGLLTAGNLATAVSVGSAAAGVAGNLQAQSQATREARRANTAASRLQDVRERRARLTQIEQARVAQAQVLQTGANRGVSGGSATQGRVGSIQTQLAGNVGFLSQASDLQGDIFRADQRRARAENRADMFGTVAQAGINSGALDIFS